MQFENDFKEIFQHFQFKSTESITIQSKILNPERKDETKLVTTLVLSIQKSGNNQAIIFIENFHTADGFGNVTYKNQGYGTQLLRYTEKELKQQLEKYSLTITKIKGKLIPNDKRYWTISIPMYYKFAENILNKEPTLTLNENKIEKEYIDKAMKIFQNFCDKVKFCFK